MSRRVSVAMTKPIEESLLSLLVRSDGQEDLCLATYQPSTGATRTTALITSTLPPTQDDRRVHGNVTVMGDYISHGAEIAREQGCGVALLHTHPGANQWQGMSPEDRETESSYANLAREITGHPLVGMTLASGDDTWSARHWNIAVGKDVDCTHADNVRVIGDRLAVSWNDDLIHPPLSTGRQIRTVSAWGDRCQVDLARRKILIVGAGSVGLDVAVRLAASGLCRITIMDFDVVETQNLDRLIGAKPRDAQLCRPKVHIALRESSTASTADDPMIEISNWSICEPEGLSIALDHDLIFSCVDRPWPRAVLNSLAYTDLIPVIDGGIIIDPFEGDGMRNATWRSHVIRPGRPCMRCNRQLDLSEAALDREGLLDNPSYVVSAEEPIIPAALNVAPLSVNVTASLLAQYVSFSVAPAEFGDPGPLQYSLSTHSLVHLEDKTGVHCPIEPQEAVGDQRIAQTGCHRKAEEQRQLTISVGMRTSLSRKLDDWKQSLTRWRVCK